MGHTMRTSNFIESISADYFLILTILALDEAKLVSEISEARAMFTNIKTSYPYSDRLIHLKREIRQFEKELTQIRSLMYRKKLSSNS